MYNVNGKISMNSAAILKQIRQEGGAIVLKHALAMADVTYQIYPVGPPHKDNTPHTRDTFKIVKGDKVIAGPGGKFANASEKYEFTGDKSNRLSFLAEGASFFVEFGTVFMEARPIIRQRLKAARADIIKDLRKMNLRMSRKK